LLPLTAGQLAQRDISIFTFIFIFNVRDPAVNVVLDIGTGQGKKIIETMCAPSATPAQLSKKQQSFQSSFHPRLD